jgi:hypothetical protein
VAQNGPAPQRLCRKIADPAPGWGLGYPRPFDSELAELFDIGQAENFIRPPWARLLDVMMGIQQERIGCA